MNMASTCCGLFLLLFTLSVQLIGVLSRGYIEVQPSNVTVRAGETGIIVCTIGEDDDEPWQAMQPQWYRAETGLGPSLGSLWPDYNYDAPAHEDGNYDIRISNADLYTDDEWFHVKIVGVDYNEQDFLVESEKAYFHVAVKPEAVYFAKNESEWEKPTFIHDTHQQLQCIAENTNPAPEDIIWYKAFDDDFEEINTGVSMHEIRGEDDKLQTYVSTLSFKADKSDNGKMLKCSIEHVAYGEFDQLTGTVELNCTMDIQFAPEEIPNAPGEYTADEGSRLEIECPVSANPTPTITWLRGNKTFTDSTTTLVFSSLQASDARADYACLAENEYGGVLSKEFKIIVEDAVNTAMIAGLVAAGVVLLIIIIVIAVIVLRKKSKKTEETELKAPYDGEPYRTEKENKQDPEWEPTTVAATRTSAEYENPEAGDLDETPSRTRQSYAAAMHRPKTLPPPPPNPLETSQ